RYQELSAYLASGDVPQQLQEWAREQAARVDEAYAVLSDPDVRAGLEDELEEAAAAEPAAAGATPATSPTERRGTAFASRTGGRLPVMALALGLFVGGAVVFAVFVTDMGLVGEGSENPASAQSREEQFIPIDTERVAELITSYQEDPVNPETLFELGEAYFLAAEWQQGLDWFLELVALEPGTVHAWTDIGTSQYNLGRSVEAKAAWQNGLDLAPEDPQLHYNLGFLYANAEPPDFESASQAWQMVLDLAPGTQLAQTVQVHMEGMQELATPEASPGTPETSPGP
ncbi:MAG: hypothetical protein V3S01_01830, partial [Dehalococcoidia bacterium]